MEIEDRIKLDKPEEPRLVLKKGCWSKPSSIYEEWADAPKDPDKLLEKESWEKWGHRKRKELVLGGNVNFVKIADLVDQYPKGPKATKNLKFTWKDLTLFNWGTDVFSEVNYYLWLYLGPNLKRTHDQKNYSFQFGQETFVDFYQGGTVQYLPFLWIPDYVKPPPPETKVGMKKSKIILDTPWCEYRENSKCRIFKIPKGVSVDCSYDLKSEFCLSPETLDLHAKGVTIGETQGDRISSTVQDIKDICISINRYRIHRSVYPPEHKIWEGPSPEKDSKEKKEKPPEFLASSFEMITEINVYDSFHDSKVVLEVDKKIKARPRRQKSSFKQIEGHKLKGKVGSLELANVAKTLRDLHAMNLLDRVTIRAYTDRFESHIWRMREEYTQKRANWVLDAFIKEFQLPLFDETNHVAEVLIKRGMVPVQILGCGAGDAENNIKNSHYRVAIVTCETSIKPPLKEAKEGSEAQYWGFYECTMDPAWFVQEQKKLIARAEAGNLAAHQNLRMEIEALVETTKNEANLQSLFYSLQTDQTAFEDAEASNFLDQIRLYLLLSSAIRLTEKEDLDEVRREIHSWNCNKSKELAGVFDGNVDAKLSHYFWEGLFPVNSQEDEIKKGKGVRPLQLSSKPSGEKTLWENQNIITPPNHCRCLFENSSIGGSTDSMRKIEVMAGTKYKTTERIHFE